MRKPSIFSRDYEKKMRKRRRNIIALSILGLFVVGILFMKFAMNNINMESLKSKVQNWIDEDEYTDNNNNEELNEDTQNDVVEEAPKEPEAKTIDLKLKEGVTLKAEYEEVEGKITFKGIKDIPSNIYYSINPNKNLILTIDEIQEMKVFNVEGKEASITKDKYVAPNGEIFNKETTLQTYSGYLWNVEAKFISDTKVAYITNLPYFGTDLNKYIWVVDLNDNSHKTLWNSKGKDIKFGEIKEKGLEATIDGNIKYVNSNGDLIN